MGEKKKKVSFLVGITGSTGSGKTTFAKSLQRKLGEKAALLTSDMYYRDQSGLPLKERFLQNMDCPEAFDNQLLTAHLSGLAQGKTADVPVYDFTDHTRKAETQPIEAKPVMIVEGLLIFSLPELRALFDYKIFLGVDADLRVCRRVLRDIIERRDSSAEAAIRQYLFSAQPMDRVYVLPQKKYADEVINWNVEDPEKIKNLTQRISKLASL